MYMNVPKHIALIPDGNRRWARQNNLPEFAGHRQAVEKTLPEIVDYLIGLGVKYFTFWAMSTENRVKRSKEEMKHLLNLIPFFYYKKVEEFKNKNVRIKVIGDISVFSQKVQDILRKCEMKTADNTGLTILFALNYGGRDEIVRAIHKLMQTSQDTVSITADRISKYLDTSDIPDPDLIIRTGGEKRMSGFMLWQGNYAEYSFSQKLFPDFSPEDCFLSLSEFNETKRNFGK